jgi:hypothetical protein
MCKPLNQVRRLNPNTKKQTNESRVIPDSLCHLLLKEIPVPKMQYDPQDTVIYREMTPESAAKFEDFCNAVRKSNRFIGTIAITETEAGPEFPIYVETSEEPLELRISRSREAFFQINGGSFRYTAYYPVELNQPPVFVLHITRGFFDVVSGYIEELGFTPDNVDDAMDQPEGGVILHRILCADFDALLGTGGKRSSVLDFLLRTSPKA